MKFHDTSNTHDSLTHYMNSLLQLKESDTTQYPLATKARDTNIAKYELALLFWQNSSSWDWDDAGNTDLPIFTATLVAEQADYTLPTTAIDVLRVEIRDATGDYYVIHPFDESNVKGRAVTDYGESSGKPSTYRLVARSIFLDPKPKAGSVTTSQGIRIYTNREVKEFSASTTTTEVGFGNLGDALVGAMAARRFAGSKMQNRIQFIDSEIQRMLPTVLGQNAQRHRDVQKRLIPASLYESYE